MPTVLRIGPYRFHFFAEEGNEPPHIHIRRDEASAKFWLDPLELEKSNHFAAHELRRIEAIISEHQQELLNAWREFFND